MPVTSDGWGYAKQELEPDFNSRDSGLKNISNNTFRYINHPGLFFRPSLPGTEADSK